MALYDQRIFSDGKHWWIAEIHQAIGSRFNLTTEKARTANGGETTEADSLAVTGQNPGEEKDDLGLMLLDSPPTEEVAILTCVSDKNTDSLRVVLPANTLNRLSHASILRLLDLAQPNGRRINMTPCNFPNPDEFGLTQLFLDLEGLRWGYAHTTRITIDDAGTPMFRQAIEVACLDDSAMRQTLMPTGAAQSVPDLRGNANHDPLPVLAESIKSLFLDIGIGAGKEKKELQVATEGMESVSLPGFGT